MTIEQFGQSVKKKYPEYANIPDAELGQQILKKYPQYNSSIKREVAPQQEKSGGLLGLAKDVGTGIAKSAGAIFGPAMGAFEGVGELGAAGIAKVLGKDEQAQQHINQAFKTSQEGGAIGRATDVTPLGAKGESVPEFLADAIGIGLDAASYLAPGGAPLKAGTTFLTQGLKQGGKQVAKGLAKGAGLDFAAGAVGGAGQALQQPDATFGSVASGALKGGGASALTGGVLRGGGAVTGATTTLAKKIPEVLFQKAPLETTQAWASRLANSIIKPSQKQFSFGRDPGRTLVEEKIVGNSLEDYARKITERKNQVGKEMDAVLSRPEVASKRINVQTAINAIDSSIADAIQGGNQSLVTRLREIKNGLEYSYVERGGKLRKSEPKNLSLSPKEVQQLKIDVGRKMKFTGEAFGSDINQARNKIYSTLNKELDKVAPEMKKLNERWGGLKGAEDSIENRINVNERGQLIKMSDVFTGAGAIAALGPAGLPAVFVRSFIESTAFKSRLANILNKIGSGGDEMAEKLLMLPKKEQKEALKSIPLIQRVPVQKILDEAYKALRQAARSGAVTPQGSEESPPQKTQMPPLQRPLQMQPSPLPPQSNRL